MHYDFKTKLNKLDSQQYRNLRIPEIDWSLNEAQELFVKLVAEPRDRSLLGFETSQRSIDDIKSIVLREKCFPVVNNVVILPPDYWYFIGANCLMDKENCKGARAKIKIRQHDDEFEESPFDNSNFEWRTVNAVFFEEGIQLFDDGTFTNTDLCLNYIKKLKYIHNAADYGSGTYTLPSGIILTGTQDCELPFGTHREIVDIAVALTSGNIQDPTLQEKYQKLNLNKLI